MNIAETLEKVKRLIFARQTAYQETFLNPSGERVLQDLARFCRATASTYDADARTHALLEGRREVFLRIQEHINLSPEQLWELKRKDF